MQKKIHVLIFPAGETNAVELHDALATCVNVEVFGASSVERHGSYIFRNYLSGLPYITDADFLTAFNALCVAHDIDLVLPTHDTVALYLAENSDRLHARVLPNDARTARICRDKKLTYETFADTDFVPEMRDSAASAFPVFVKPRMGQGAVGAYKAEHPGQLPENARDYVISEYLPGEEYTVDCLTDRHGRLCVISPRSRGRVMAGISVAGKTECLTPEIEHIAHAINSRLSFLGLWWFQIKRDARGCWKLLEISARCAGTMGLTRATGVNLPLLSVYAATGRDISVSPNPYRVTMDSTLIRRYRIDYKYTTVYFDFDDTLVINESVNIKMLCFLYQCKNNGKECILLSKHENDILSSLSKYCIDKNIFSKIISIDHNEEKYTYILRDNSIFIDNSWHERQSVATHTGIPVFDVDGVDALLDWRS
ncbi:ATP-grasp domain-containing protein [uncultured Desulfovibrio sp.]|uniref:ATP-grasp domain-containing protein n=1 Tax=uncultured Desulfovibrio sp. TaxID=167968 RepID=UPI0025FA7A01|nr:ATP-grasp domain-containing protein [uncultured Desulfovibrio sp.]